MSVLKKVTVELINFDNPPTDRYPHAWHERQIKIQVEIGGQVYTTLEFLPMHDDVSTTEWVLGRVCKEVIDRVKAGERTIASSKQTLLPREDPRGSGPGGSAPS